MLLAGGRALVITDLVGNIPKAPGFRGWMLGLLGSGGVFGVPRIVKMRQVKSRANVRKFLTDMALLPDLKAVVVAHGPAVMDGAADVLKAAAERV